MWLVLLHPEGGGEKSGVTGSALSMPPRRGAERGMAVAKVIKKCEKMHVI